MPFPSPSLTVPALSPYQFSYRGVAFGGLERGMPYQLKSLKGVDMAPVTSGDQQRALDQGELVGVDLSAGRDIEIDLIVQSDGVSIDHARQELGGALGVAGTTEEPLYLQLPSGAYACMCRPRKYNFPIDVNMFVARGIEVPALLHATDPRWYAVPTKTATIGSPSTPGGLVFPAPFPWRFSGDVPEVLSVYNNGKFEMRPVFIVTGPCRNPVIQNLSLAGAPWLGFNITLNTGDTLTINTDFETVLYTPNGGSGESKRNARMEGSTWFNLPAASLSEIIFTTSDGRHVAGTLTCQSADAYMVL